MDPGSLASLVSFVNLASHSRKCISDISNLVDLL